MIYNRFSETTLRFARVPPRPEPPIGEPGSVRTFRAGRNYFYIRLLGWGAGQIGAVIGLVFSIGFMTWLSSTFERARAPRAETEVAPSQNPAPSAEVSPPPSPSASLSTSSPDPTPSPRVRRRGNRWRFDAAGIRILLERMPRGAAEFVGRWFIPSVVFLELFGILAFLAQLPATYALVRIEFEQHWYIVTDRSLRIRTGVLSLSESTMSFANLQQVEVKQGPLQRLLGLADVRVRSAGGGGDAMGEADEETLHMGVFRSVENAHEIRDLILARLRAYREAGLGDPDQPTERESDEAGAISAETLEAAREVLRQTRALRETASSFRRMPESIT